MYYAIVHRPEADVGALVNIGQKYDPHHDLVGPHVTLLFPVPGDRVGEAVVRSRAAEVAGSTRPFGVRLRNVELSWDQWLFLTPTDGRSQFDRIHSKLYEGPLAEFLRSDIPFVPHVSLGHFAVEGSDYSLKDPRAVPLDENRYETARDEIQALGLDIRYTATQLELIGVDDDFTRSERLGSFQFSQ
jgi:2'-5' RNA ligase